MEFKPSKSRNLVLKQGHFQFKIGKDVIPTVTEKPIKSLGRWYRAKLNDKALERSDLPWKYKAWGYQQGVLPSLL